jgi:hypothetical protein
VGGPSVLRVNELLTCVGLTLSKDIVLDLPVAVFHPATLPPPPPEPYPYPAPDAYLGPFSNPSTSPPPLLPTPMPVPYAERAQSPLYAYPALLSAPSPLNGHLVIPPYTSHDGQLWFSPPPPAYIGDPSYYQPPPLRPASANPSTMLAPNSTSGLPVSGTPDHVLGSFPHHHQQQYPPQPEQTIGHGTLAARISHHLRATSRARSVSPSPAPSQLPPPPPTLLEVEVLAPKPMPSPKLVSIDPSAQSSGRVGTRTRCLSVVKLEEMAARAAAETEAKAAADKTLPAPPVPSGKPLGHGGLRRPGAQDIFGKLEPEPEMAPRTPSLSALSLLRPPQRHDQPPYVEQERGRQIGDSGLDALERRLVEQVGTRRHPPPPAPPNTDVPVVMADPPPAPVPAPVPVPIKGKGKAAPTAEELGSVDAGAAVNESAISSLALGAEEDFGGRNANANVNVNVNVNVLAGLELEGDGEDVEGDDVDADADGRTQRLSKGAGASSGSERGTHKARSRKSAKSDSKDDKEKKAKKKREVRDEEAAKLKRAAKGRVAEWLERLAPAEPAVSEQDTRSPTLPTEQAPAPAPEPTVAATAPAPTQEPPPVIVESKPNPRSSGFISVATLRRAPISLPAPESAPTASQNLPAAARRFANKYPPSSPSVEMKYDVKSARGGRGGRVTAVASIWAEASKAAPTKAAKAGGSAAKAKGNAKATAAPKSGVPSTSKPAPAPPQAKSVKPMTSIVAPGSTKAPAKDDDGRVFISRGRPAASAPAVAPPAKAEKVDNREDAPRVPRTLFGLGVAAAATPSSPALSSSIATPVLSSTASLAHPPGSRARARPSNTPMTPPTLAPAPPSPQPPPPPPPQSQSQPAAAAGWRSPLVSGAGLKADLAFGQARLRDLIRRYQGQAA